MLAVDFKNWLITELNKRGWNQSELAVAAGVTRTAISDVLSGRRNPGVELCNSLARALRLPPEVVFRHAGLLPAKKENPWFPRFETLLEELNEDDLEDLYALALAKLERRKTKTALQWKPNNAE